MALYEYRCPICEVTFEQRRPMSEADDPVTCPSGHDGARRLLSVFAAVGSRGGSAPSGPCGGSCACFPD